MEHIDFLIKNKLKIILSDDQFKFGTDSVALAQFADVKPNDSVLDLCSGSGIIPLIISAKSKSNKIYGIEIDSDVANRAVRSVELNGLSERITIINGDIKNVTKLIKNMKFSVITVNPPYSKKGSGQISNTVASARSELHCTLEDVCIACAKMLNDKGKCYMVHKVERLNEVLGCLSSVKLIPKQIKFINFDGKNSPKLFLVKAILNANEGLTILPSYIPKEESGF